MRAERYFASSEIGMLSLRGPRERSCKPVSTTDEAEVAELADALDSGSSARKGVRVQIPASAPPLRPP
jgi:hypothetical protein